MTYQSNIVKDLETHKYLFILKSVGLGITEVCLRWILYMSMRNDGRQVPIIVGPNLNLAVKLMKRIRRIFESHNIFFDSKETYLEINGG